MKKGLKKRCCPSLILLLLFLGGPVFYSGCVPKNSDNKEALTLQQAIDNIVTPRLHVGAIIGIITRNQRQVLSYGVKTLNRSEKPDANTVFEIGSITKTFTAIILADMHLKGEVNLDDVVEIYHPADKVTIPGSNGTKINLTHLATHTSGIPSNPSNVEEHRENPNDPFASYTVDHFYEFLSHCSLNFPVGTRHSYSNAGVVPWRWPTVPRMKPC